jgi:hypothetical protein
VLRIGQVLSLCMAPFLLDHPKVLELFPAVRRRLRTRE